MLSQALAFWNAIKGKVEQTVKSMTSNALRCERYDVTTEPDGTVVGVRQPFGETELFIPYSQEVADAKAGDTVLVIWRNTLSTAKAWCYGDGPELAGGGGGSAHYTATIGTNWTGTTAPYTQNITVSGISAEDMPVVDVILSSTYATAQAQLEAWGCVYRITTSANKITVYATEKTTTSIPIQLEVAKR